MRSTRIEPLECLRGCAAIVVVTWHTLIGFAPLLSGQFPHAVIHPAIGRLWFAPFNGAAAVSFFFVLSGFVLPFQYFRLGNIELVGRGVLKRYPRLLGSCTLVVLLSWLAFSIGAYRYTQAAAISGSPWLADFGYAGVGANFRPSFLDALWSGSFGTFYNGDARFDSSLWTMHPEIVGSIVCLGVAPALRWTRGPILPCCLAVVVGVMLVKVDEHIPQFLLGTLLARLLYQRPYRVPPAIAIPMLVAAFLMLSFDGTVGSFAWIKPFGLDDWHTYPMVWAPAAAILIYVTLGTPWLMKTLSGRVPRLLGRLSFPIYLVHLPVICSFGSWTYLKMLPICPWGIAVGITYAVICLVTFLLAWPLSRFDGWWVNLVNGAARAVNAEAGRRQTATILPSH